MIIFKTLTYQNFLACGNTPIKIDLNKDPHTLHIGKNGAGKSILLDALCFVLFGKTYRSINKPTIVNSENGKDCLVTCEFDLNGKSYKVVRGIKPNVFDIYKEGIHITKDASVSDYQDYLEKHILKMNYKSFTQIVILGSASFTPFMQLKAGDRREIIEDLLDIQIFSVMNVVAKQKLQVLRENLEKLDNEVRTIKNSIEHVKSTIESLTKNKKSDIEDLRTTYKENNDRIKVLNKLIIDASETEPLIKKENVNLNALKKKLSGVINIRADIESSVSKLSKEVGFFANNDVCPTCTQNIDSIFKKEKISVHEGKINIGKESRVSLDKKLFNIETEIEGIETNIKTLFQKMNSIKGYKHEISLLDASNKVILTSMDDADNSERLIADNVGKLDGYEKSLHTFEESRKSIIEEREYFDQILFLLKDGGIKTKIVSKYLPIINKIINKYLVDMNLYCQFHLDENFNEVIKARLKTDYSYNNFSEGQKARINIAILFAWRQLAKMRNSVNTNLLILDEIFDSSLDSEGTDEFIRIMLNDLTKDTNTFVISHKTDQLLDKFSAVYNYELVKGFSRRTKVGEK